MRIKTFFRHIGTGLKNVFRNGWMSFAAISAVSMTLLLVGGLVAILMNVNKLAADVEGDVSIRVYIDQTANKDDQDTLEKRIQSLNDVEKVEFSSKEQELDNVIGSYGDTFTLFGEDENPLYDVFVVSAKSPEVTGEVASKIEKMPNVSRVNYGGAQADKLLTISGNVRNFALIIIFALILIAIFLISNTIRMTIFARGTEIEIMKLVGATNWYIRWPFVIEGATIGLLGSIIPVALIGFSYKIIYQRVMSYLSGTSFAILNPNPFLMYLLIALAAIGIIIGSIGSSLSIRRFLKI